MDSMFDTTIWLWLCCGRSTGRVAVVLFTNFLAINPREQVPDSSFLQCSTVHNSPEEIPWLLTRVL